MLPTAVMLHSGKNFFLASKGDNVDRCDVPINTSSSTFHFLEADLKYKGADINFTSISKDECLSCISGSSWKINLNKAYVMGNMLEDCVFE